MLAVAMVLAVDPAAADPWYEHYSNAEQALEDQDWRRAVEQLNEALERKGDSGARVRSYGMNVTSYFPYLKLGIAYYHLDQLDAALQAFETELRLGAVAQSEPASAELERYRGLALEARETAIAEEKRRIVRIVQQNLGLARDLEGRDLLEEAIAALDQALAVAPDDADARDAMNQLRQRLADRERQQERELSAARLIEDGRGLLQQEQYGEAASRLRQALFLDPSAEVRELLDRAETGLRSVIEAQRRELEVQRLALADELAAVRELESEGQLAAALDRLQSVLVLEPASPEAQSVHGRLLQAYRDAEAESTRQDSVRRLLAEAESAFEAGSAEESLSAANRVLALDPGNAAALEHIAQSYAMISGRLLGTGAKQNIPPAVRFVDLREEADDGTLMQWTRTRSFRLNGVIIDDSPVEVVFYVGERLLEAALNIQPLGEYYLTEFSVETTLTPGLSTFRLVATDSEDLVSSSEYTVLYARPFVRTPWFLVLLLGGSVSVGATLFWRRSRRRKRLRKRRFNPYVAGAPVLEDDMFFGRRELVDRILQTIHNNSLLLYGERRIGKTSIQHQIKKRLRELDDPSYDFHPVYVDLQGTPETRFFGTIAEDIFQELAPVLDGLRPVRDTDEDYSYRDFVRDLHAVLKALKKRTTKKVKLVLLIDEVDELNDYDPRINQKLRSLFMKSFAENLAAVVSGVQIKKQWEREGSPWYNFFEEIEVAPLGPQEARDLIERPIQSMFKLDGGVADRIISLTGGKPYLIQKLCISLVTRLHEDRRRRITIADVEAVGRPEGG